MSKPVSAPLFTKARVNQAAINYHFKGKDGLYLEVLKPVSYTHLTLPTNREV